MLNSVTEPAHEIPVRAECDVLIVGGGTAGVCAAIASARNGAKTILVEQLPLPSGTMTNGGIVANSFYSTWTEECHDPKRVVEGIAKEIMDRVIAKKGCPGGIKVDPTQNGYRRPYMFISDPEVYKATICEMLMEAGVKTYVHMFFSKIIHDKTGKPMGIIVESKSGREALLAKCFVDCSGDGDLAVSAGAISHPFFQEYNVRPLASIGKVFGIANVDFDRFLCFAEEEGILVGLSRERNEGESFSGKQTLTRISVNFHNGKSTGQYFEGMPMRSVTFFSIHENTIDFVNGIGRQNVNIKNIEELSSIEMEMQIFIQQFMEVLQTYIPGFEYAFIKSAANQIGIRASRVVETDYVPSIEEITSGVRYEDEIGNYGHSDYMPVDEKSIMHNQGFYGIPYRMILPKGLDNVFVAGRMVSTTLRSHMSTRNTVSCMIQGQAAGTAAALCVSRGETSRELPYPILREALIKGKVHFEPII